MANKVKTIYLYKHIYLLLVKKYVTSAKLNSKSNSNIKSHYLLIEY